MTREEAEQEVLRENPQWGGHCPRLFEEFVQTRLAVGRRFFHDLVLMDGTTRRIEGVVKKLPLGKTGTRITLVYGENGKMSGDDANWYNSRQHYPWKPVEESA